MLTLLGQGDIAQCRALRLRCAGLWAGFLVPLGKIIKVNESSLPLFSSLEKNCHFTPCVKSKDFSLEIQNFGFFDLKKKSLFYKLKMEHVLVAKDIINKLTCVYFCVLIRFRFPLLS